MGGIETGLALEAGAARRRRRPAVELVKVVEGGEEEREKPLLLCGWDYGV